MKHRAGIRFKVVTLVIFTSLLIICIGMGGGYFFGFRLLRNAIAEDYVKMANLLSDHINAEVNGTVDKLDGYISNPLIIREITKVNKEFEGTDEESIRKMFAYMDAQWEIVPEDDVIISRYMNSGAGTYLAEIEREDNNLSEIFVTDKYGGLVGTSEKTSDFYQADEKWWQEAFAGGEGRLFIGGVEYDGSADVISISFALPVRDEEGVVIGVCKAVIDVEELFAPLGTFAIGRTGHAFLADANGYIVFHEGIKPLSEKVCEDKEFRELINSPERWAVMTSPHLHKGDWFTAFAPVDNNHLLKSGVKLFVFVDENTRMVFRPIYRLFAQMVSILVILLLFLLPAGFIFGGIFVKPIKKLHEATEHIEKGELDYPIGVKTNDEIEQLADSFKSMMVALQDKQKEIQEAKVYAENIISSMIDTLIVVNPDATIKNLNRATCDLLDYAEEELIGEDVSLIFSEDKGEGGEQEIVFKPAGLKELIKEGYVRDIALRYKTKNGEKIPVSFSGSVMRDENGRLLGVVGVARDMRQTRELIAELKSSKDKLENWSKTLEEKVREKTGSLEKSLEEAEKNRQRMISMLDDNNKIRKNLEKNLKELKDTQDMLVQTEKLSSLGRLVSEIAHEVNNPLMAISGRAQLGLMEDIQNKEILEDFKIIQEQCSRAADIIKRLLDFSKPTKGEIGSVDLKDLVEDTLKLVEHQYSLINIKIFTNFSQEPVIVNVDGKQLEEVLFNIIKNAAEAMTEGGSITISTQKEQGKARIEVKDTGAGMSEDIMKNIFDPFYTTKKEGTGLGLSVCFGLIKEHGGDLKYESKLGEGTTAIIILPIEG